MSQTNQATCSEETSVAILCAISELEEALRMFGLEMVREDDPRATDGATHASPAYMVGCAAVAIRAALGKLKEVRS